MSEADRLELVSSLVKEPIDWLATEVRDYFLTAEDGPCEDAVSIIHARSPLEARFYVWWHVHGLAKAALMVAPMFWLRPQQPIDLGPHRYVLDFVVVSEPEVYVHQALVGVGPAPDEHALADYRGLRHPFIAIELDGHEFHERTKDQVRRRDRRDRDLQAAGWCIFHFSGSEFAGDPVKCVDEVWREAWRRSDAR